MSAVVVPFRSSSRSTLPALSSAPWRCPENVKTPEKHCVTTCHVCCMKKWVPAPDRRDPVSLVLESDKGRIQELPIRYGRMMVSPFTFYRRTSDIMAADVRPAPVSGLVREAPPKSSLSLLDVTVVASKRRP